MARLSPNSMVGGYLILGYTSGDTDLANGLLNPYKLSDTFRIMNLGGTDNRKALVFGETVGDDFYFDADFAGAGNTGNSMKFNSGWQADIMTWRGDGNIGINVTNPGEKLDINGNLRTTGNISSTNGYIDVQRGTSTIAGTTFANGWIRVGTSTAGIAIDPNEIYGFGANMAIGTVGAYDILFNPNNVTVMKVLNTQKVDIAGTSDTGIFHIKGGANGGDVYIGSSGTGNTNMQFGASGNIKGETSQFKIMGTGVTPISFYANGIETMRVVEGKVGIGANNIAPSYALQSDGARVVTYRSGVDATATPLRISRLDSDAEELRVWVNDSTTYLHHINDEDSASIRFRIQNTDTERATNKGLDASDREVLIIKGDKAGGYVGINKAPSTYALEVSGEVEATTFRGNVISNTGTFSTWKIDNGYIFDNNAQGKTQADANIVMYGGSTLTTDGQWFMKVMSADKLKRIHIDSTGAFFIDKTSGSDVVKSGFNKDGLVGKLLTAQSVSGTNLDKVAPDSPSNVTAVQFIEQTATSEFINIRINWNALAVGTPQEIERNGDLEGFKVYLREGLGGLFYPYAVARKDATEYVIRNLKGNTNYYVAVTSFDVLGNESTLTGNPILISTTKDATIPKAPAGLSIVNGKMMFYVKWGAVVQNTDDSTCVDIDYYEVMRCERDKGSSGAYTAYAVIFKTYGTGIIDKEVAYDKEYKYKVRAVDTSGNASGNSGEVDAGTPLQIGEADIVANSILASHLKVGFDLSLDDKAGQITAGGGGVTIDSEGIDITNGKISISSEDGTALIEGGRIQIDGMNVGVVQSENGVYNGNFTVPEITHSVGDMYISFDGTNQFGGKYWYSRRSSGPTDSNVYLQGLWNKAYGYLVLGSAWWIQEITRLCTEKVAQVYGVNAKQFMVQKMISDCYNHWLALGLTCIRYNNENRDEIIKLFRMTNNEFGDLRMYYIPHSINPFTGEFNIPIEEGLDAFGNIVFVPHEILVDDMTPETTLHGQTMYEVRPVESKIGKTGFARIGLEEGHKKEFVIIEQNVDSIRDYTTPADHVNYIFSVDSVWEHAPEVGGDDKLFFEVDELLPTIVNGKEAPFVSFGPQTTDDSLVEMLLSNTDTLTMGLGSADLRYQMTFGSVKLDDYDFRKFSVESLQYVSVLAGLKVRYIRDWVNGSNVNTDNVWTEITASVCLGQLVNITPGGLIGTSYVNIYSPVASETADFYNGMIVAIMDDSDATNLQSYSIIDYIPKSMTLPDGKTVHTLVVDGTATFDIQKTYSISIINSLGKAVTGSVASDVTKPYALIGDGNVLSKNLEIANGAVAMSVSNATFGTSNVTFTNTNALALDDVYNGKVLVAFNTLNPLDIKILPIVDYVGSSKTATVMGIFDNNPLGGNPPHVFKILDPTDRFAKAGNTGLQSVTLDLGGIYNLYEIRIVHYYDPMENMGMGRTFNGTRTQVSEDGVKWYDVYNSAYQGTYVESPAGLVIGGVTVQNIPGLGLTPVANPVVVYEYMHDNCTTHKFSIKNDLTTKITDPKYLPKDGYEYDSKYLSSGARGDVMIVSFDGDFSFNALFDVVANKLSGLSIILLDGKEFRAADTSEWMWRIHEMIYEGYQAGRHTLMVVALGEAGMHTDALLLPDDANGSINPLTGQVRKHAGIMIDKVDIYSYVNKVYTNSVEILHRNTQMWEKTVLKPMGMTLGVYAGLGLTAFRIPIKYRVRLRLENGTENANGRAIALVTGVQAELGKLDTFNRVNYGLRSFPVNMLQTYNPLLGMETGIGPEHFQEYLPTQYVETGVQERHIADRQITTRKMAHGSVTNEILADGNISIDKLSLRQKVKLQHFLNPADFGELTVMPLIQTSFAPMGFNPITNTDGSIRFIIEDIDAGSENIFYKGQLQTSMDDDEDDYDFTIERVILAFGTAIPNGDGTYMFTPPYAYGWIVKFETQRNVQLTDKVIANYWVNI